ncbi:MAG: lipoprotein [Beijerinckiaceae bacterium]|nr:lipoprotein [Beijerinckiaceae bacterium]
MSSSFRPITILTISLLSMSLGGCGKRGPLEPPPGDVAAKQARSTAPAKTNTFFNPNVTPEQLPIDDIDPANQPINPQLGSTGAVAPATRLNPKAAQPGIAPVGGGRRAKRILPPQDSFILDPLL